MNKAIEQRQRISKLRLSISKVIIEYCNDNPGITTAEVIQALTDELSFTVKGELKHEIGDICEGCGILIEYGEGHRDSEGVDLCGKCWEEMSNEEINN